LIGPHRAGTALDTDATERATADPALLREVLFGDSWREIRTDRPQQQALGETTFAPRSRPESIASPVPARRIARRAQTRASTDESDPASSRLVSLRLRDRMGVNRAAFPLT
jgi:hypothetical protein